MLIRFYSIAVCLVLAISAFAQRVDTDIRIFNKNIHSLKIAPVDKPYGVPIIALGSDEQLNVNFDLIDYDAHYLRYSITHCNADWQPSRLIDSEFVSGFNQADITDFAQSEGTFTHYFNYNFTFPNDDMQILKSGNYLLKVSEQDDPDNVLFQTRFSVCEHTVNVAVETTSRTDIDYNDAHQQVSFEVTYKPGTIQNPYQELKALVTQNSRTDNAVMVENPLMVGGNKVTYDHNPTLIFNAGNEYRRMETVNVNALNMGVSRIITPPSIPTSLVPQRSIFTIKRNSGVSPSETLRRTTVTPKPTILSPTSPLNLTICCQKVRYICKVSLRKVCHHQPHS